MRRFTCILIHRLVFLKKTCEILLFTLFTVLLLLLSFMGIRFAENVNNKKQKLSILGVSPGGNVLW